jgi:eukaryotic-like serine/threonine-protein kinase
MSFEVGQIFGEYAITTVLDCGSSGQLYKVEHRITRRSEVMKVLPVEVSTENEIKRFEREMRVLGRLSHPNIASLHNALHTENQLILVMEFVDGQTLESLFSPGRLPLETGIEYIRQILSALSYAHGQGVVHRNVTPANVIVTATDQVKLTAFGLSKSFGDSLLTSCGEILAPLPYLAPEQVKGITHPDSRSDLYSVGAILYELLTGRKPFGADRRIAAVVTDAEGEPQPPSQLEPCIPRAWDNIVARALARDPNRRYESAEEFLAAIAQLDGHSEGELRLPKIGALWIGVAVLAGLVLVAVATPAINGFRAVASPTVPPRIWHIIPPEFAASAMVRGEQSERIPPSRVSKSPARPHPRRPAHSVVATLSGSAPTVEASPVQVAAPPAPLEQHLSEPVSAESNEPNIPEATTQPKKKFWSKLNIFKKSRSKSQ